ncbi:DUF3006 domain-containing protein [Sediminibacillus massiliensis]|uniref:DUF3006 domain-containing protein n=1 Tax=Sediminibacillus massiliensis TaxID=1926277 RepID=UPI0009884588|nr:DUF3006 domain-containing protein [Sediminibacillus massiliensis]
MKGVLDRIEDEQHAVILIEKENKEIVVPVEKLPSGSKEDSWFEIEMDGKHVTSIKLDQEKTASRQGAADNLLKELRSKSKGSRFKRKG